MLRHDSTSILTPPDLFTFINEEADWLNDDSLSPFFRLFSITCNEALESKILFNSLKYYLIKHRFSQIYN